MHAVDTHQRWLPREFYRDHADEISLRDLALAQLANVLKKQHQVHRINRTILEAKMFVKGFSVIVDCMNQYSSSANYFGSMYSSHESIL